MPTYHARGITVRLGSMPLAETTTSNVAIRKGDVAKRQNETAEKKLLRSPYLAEKRAPLDDHPESFDLNWLAEVPFMQVQVDPAFSHLPNPHDGPPGPTAVGSNSLQALAVHLKLSDKSFSSGFNDRTHLKMEVLFNSQLSACSLIHYTDVRMGAKSPHQIFAGYRLDFLAERPWVLLPPFTAADGEKRKARSAITSFERWNELSAALLTEARDRGTDLNGDSPPSARFIQALASMQPPPYLSGLQKPDGKTFGVVDVIITAGTGHKPTTGTTYLKRPQKLRDPSYVLRSDIDPCGEDAAVEVDDARDGIYEECEEEEWDKFGRLRADEIGPADESPLKRRACLGVKGGGGHASQSSNLGSPLTQIPCLPPPNRVASQPITVASGSKTSSRCPAPEHCSGGFKQPLPSTNRDRVYDTLGTMPETQKVGRRPSFGSQSYHTSSLPSSIAQPLQLPINTVASNTESSFASVSGSLAVDSYRYQTTLPFASPYSQSSPLYMPPTSSPNFTNPDWSMGSSPWSLSYQNNPMNSSLHIQPARQNLDTSSYVDPNEVSFLPPTYPFLGDLGSTGPIMPSLPSFDMRGPLPPTAMFSVTTKPRKSTSPVKSIAAATSPGKELMINRVVIRGRRGKVVVDRSWEIPRRVQVGRKYRGKPTIDDRTKAFNAAFQNIDSGTSDLRQPHTSGGKPQAQSATIASHTNLPANTAEQSHQQRRDSQQDHPHGPVLLPYLKRHQGPADAEMPVNSWIDVPDRLAPLVSLHVLTNSASLLTPASRDEPALKGRHSAVAPTERPATLLRLPLPRTMLPGVQGPKAAPFVFDDPEEVVREAARSRRSRSPAKPRLTVQVPDTVLPASHQLVTSSSGAGNSSGLSSVPPTPLYEATPATEAASTPFHPPPQFDGSSERMPPSTPLPALNIRSPTRSAVLPRPDPHTPVSSVSSSSKKRTLSQGGYVKKTRSPDRLKTTDNPPLNNDCVIAFAESADKDAEHGVLRQVKGERQGTFKEDYVVLAVRFFIAGDGEMVV